MRPLLVGATTATALFAMAVGASAPVALHRGDAITDRQLFAYLSYPVSPGDWVRYRVVFADHTAVVKTIGFGAEAVGGKPTLFVETHVHAQAVTGLPPGGATGIGADAVLKTYVAGTSFGDLAHSYLVVTSALKIGGFEYEIAPGAEETYSALSGSAFAAPRDGTVKSVEAVTLRVGEQPLSVTHVVADFRTAALPVGGVATPFTLEVWQSPDAPLGTVAIRSDGARSVDWRLISFGRGDYTSLFVRSLDDIRRAARPAMP